MDDAPDCPAEPDSSAITATIGGTRLELLDGGAERLAAIIGLIDGAKASIRLLFYMFTSEMSGQQVRDALVAAARRGVDVKLLIDGYGCSNLGPGFFAALEEAGGSFFLFHPSYGRRYLLRNHQKLAIADDTRAIIGGANIADHYFDRDESGKRWRDLWLLLDGPAVAAAARYFDALFKWTRTKGTRIRALRRIITRHSQNDGALQWKFSGPMRRRNPWPAAIARDITSGSRLDLIAAYFSPPRAMLRRIGALAVRGQVRIITAAKSDNNATVAAARHTYSRLLRRGVGMYEYQAARLHTKLVIVDDAVHIGSSNFDFRSLYLNLEIMLRIEDPAFASAMRGYFERELTSSEWITPAIHQQRSTLWRRFKWTLSHFLVTSMDYTVTRRLNFGPEG